MLQLSLQRGDVGLLTAIGLVALSLAVWRYGRCRGLVSPGCWWLLVALRAAAVVVVLLLLFGPVLTRVQPQHQKRRLVIALDSSASMQVVDDRSGASRFERARRGVEAWSEALAASFDLRLIRFADQAIPLDDVSALVGLVPDGPATSLSRALAAAAGTGDRAEIEAVLLFSDGVQTAAGDPVAAARKYGLKVHAIGVGNSLRESPSYRDARVAGLDVPDPLPVDNRARVTARVGHVGLAGRVVPVLLEEDGEEVARVDCALADTPDGQTVVLEFTPTAKGRHVYTARIPVQPDETIEPNNHRSTPARVVDARIRVLYLEGSLRAEYGALVQRFFSKDPDLEFLALVQTRPGVFLSRSNMEGLELKALPTEPSLWERFDVVLLGDLDASAWRPGQIELLVNRVRSGAGLLVVGGYHSLGPGGYAGTPLEEILPVRCGPREIGQVTEPFVPTLTAEGLAHPIVAGLAPFFPGPAGPPKVGSLPALDGCTRVLGPSPGASVLAVLDPSESPPMPVLAVQPVGSGRTAVFTADTTRNWQQTPRALDQESPFLRFWGQMIRWLANRAPDESPGASLSAHTDRAAYEPDEPVLLSAIVRDDQRQGTDRANVAARLRSDALPDAPAVSLAPVTGAPGQYRATLEALPPGVHEVIVEATLDGHALEPQILLVEIGRPNLEFDRLDLDERTLRAIASATGGRYLPLEAARDLVTELQRADRRRLVMVQWRLAPPWPSWAAVVGFLTAEWILRRRARLR